MKKQIKELRIKIDGLAQLTRNLNPVKVSIIEGYKDSKEIDKSVDSLILAKAWLGKLLGELGVESPYPKDGTRKDINDIEPTADKQSFLRYKGDDFKTTIEEFESKNHIEKVDWLRQEIKKIIEEVSKWYTHTKPPSREFSIARTNAYNYLCEARFWLGFELGRIKENK